MSPEKLLRHNSALQVYVTDACIPASYDVHKKYRVPLVDAWLSELWKNNSYWRGAFTDPAFDLIVSLAVLDLVEELEKESGTKIGGPLI